MTHERGSLPRCTISLREDNSPFAGKAACVTCKGRLMCGLPSCPLLDAVCVRADVRLASEFSGYALSFFAGWSEYPTVPQGPLVLPAPLDGSPPYDNPSAWRGMSVEEIVSLRAHLVRPFERRRVSHPSTLREAMEEISLSVTPVDVEIRLAKIPRFSMEFSGIVPPMGPSAPLESLRVTSHPTIPPDVDSLIRDGTRADTALVRLYENGHDVYYLARLLGAGILGEQKKVLPTSWSITTAYNIITRHLIEKLKGYPLIDGYLVMAAESLGTRLAILLMPFPWEYEQLESWIPKAFWSRRIPETLTIAEHETHQGRSDYATREGGDYYAVRFGVCEMLEKMKRQAAALVFEEAGPGFSLPVGVWAHMESVRHATKGGTFPTLAEALEWIQTRLTVPLAQWRKKSIILNQARLGQWLE